MAHLAAPGVVAVVLWLAVRDTSGKGDCASEGLGGINGRADWWGGREEVRD